METYILPSTMTRANVLYPFVENSLTALQLQRLRGESCSWEAEVLHLHAWIIPNLHLQTRLLFFPTRLLCQ